MAPIPQKSPIATTTNKAPAQNGTALAAPSLEVQGGDDTDFAIEAMGVDLDSQSSTVEVSTACAIEARGVDLSRQSSTVGVSGGPTSTCTSGVMPDSLFSDCGSNDASVDMLEMVLRRPMRALAFFPGRRFLDFAFGVELVDPLARSGKPR